MRNWTAVLAVLLGAVTCPVALWGQDGRNADDRAIRARLAAYADARNVRDAHAEALCYAEDGDFRSGAGPLATGRAQVEKELAVADPSYRFALTVDGVRFLDADVAIAETAILAGPAGQGIRLIGSYVMVRKAGAWLIGAARIAREMPSSAPQ
jgi:uncharacterized protein (TIGR02246 family)